jgi:hypothetical protein
MNTPNWLDGHLDDIRKKIEVRAQELARENERPRPELVDYSKAALEYTSDKPRPADMSRWDRILSFLTNVTLVSTFLAIVFGVIGFLDHGSAASSGFIDIAKIFAGAIVGSTAATAVSRTAR